VLVALAAAAIVSGSAPAAPQPQLSFRVFANTGHKMDAILWTGKQFLYVENTTNTIWAAPAAGLPLRRFASMPKLTEETRCVLSPGTHGYPAGVVFCHSPDDKIYEISGDGSSVNVFATLPVPSGTTSDGALALDEVGTFGYQLVAATGRSGAGQPPGGAVYTISASSVVKEIGSYSGPGADEVAIAPIGFGSVGGQALLALDAGADNGSVVAMNAAGKTRTLVTLPGGANPIAPIPAVRSGSRTPPAGLYVTNDINPDVYVAPAGPLSRYTGDVIVGTENKAQFWIIEPRGNSSGFTKIAVRHTLRGGKDSLECAVDIG
jgi:hypothetical protein